MVAQSTRDTRPERLLRSELHRNGYRFRIHVRPLPELRRSADAVFPRERVAVFVDGCFWHGCREHRSIPKANSAWWEAKIDQNRRRDADTDRRLRLAGWIVVRIWEHEDVQGGAAKVVSAISRARLARSRHS